MIHLRLRHFKIIIRNHDTSLHQLISLQLLYLLMLLVHTCTYDYNIVYTVHGTVWEFIDYNTNSHLYVCINVFFCLIFIHIISMFVLQFLRLLLLFYCYCCCRFICLSLLNMNNQISLTFTWKVTVCLIYIRLIDWSPYYYCIHKF